MSTSQNQLSMTFELSPAYSLLTDADGAKCVIFRASSYSAPFSGTALPCEADIRVPLAAALPMVDHLNRVVSSQDFDDDAEDDVMLVPLFLTCSVGEDDFDLVYEGQGTHTMYISGYSSLRLHSFDIAIDTVGAAGKIEFESRYAYEGTCNCCAESDDDKAGDEEKSASSGAVPLGLVPR